MFFRFHCMNRPESSGPNGRPMPVPSGFCILRRLRLEAHEIVRRRTHFRLTRQLIGENPRIGCVVSVSTASPTQRKRSIDGRLRTADSARCS